MKNTKLFSQSMTNDKNVLYVRNAYYKLLVYYVYRCVMCMSLFNDNLQNRGISMDGCMS